MDEGSGSSIELLEDYFEFLAQGAFPRHYLELQLYAQFGFEKVRMFAVELYSWRKLDLLEELLSFSGFWRDSLFFNSDDELLGIVITTPVARIQSYALEELSQRKIDKRTVLRTMLSLEDGGAIYTLLESILRDPLPSLDDLVSFGKAVKLYGRRNGIDVSKESLLVDEAIERALSFAQYSEVEMVYNKVCRGVFSPNDFPERFHILAPKFFPSLWLT